MRIYLTGASGFVGSNLAHVFAREHGAEVVSPGHEHVDLTDELVVRRSVLVTRPDAIVHAAIWNDPAALHTDRRRAWDAYVGATRNVVAAANAGDAHVVLISTDWVFDGTQGPAPETEPPNPINTYGFLKACSELVVTQSAARGTIARIAGVQGIHRARPHTPRAQDAGFGYLVLSLVDALRAGERFAVWDGPGLNLLATPTLATDAAELVWRALTREVTGTLHCCGGEHVDRVGLARRATRVFELDSDLLDVAPPPADVISGGRIPRDTRLDATATARSLDVELARSGRDAAKAPRPGRVIMEPGMSRLTVAQALVRFLAVQETERDGERSRFFAGCFGIFGHGNVAGLGQALHQYRELLPYHPARNEQAMVHIAAGYARQKNRLGTFACTTSVGPGATNMVTGAALATINRLPVLLLPSDTFATRTPHPVLQMLEVPHDATCRSTTASGPCRGSTSGSSAQSS